MRNKSPLLLLSFLFVSCAQYPYASKVKMVSFNDDVSPGKAVGNIRGEDCTWSVLGYEMGGKPTIDRAFINTRNQATALQSAGFDSKNNGAAERLRYVNNVTTSNEGFNAYVVGKQCLIVTGVGYL